MQGPSGPPPAAVAGSDPDTRTPAHGIGTRGASRLDFMPGGLPGVQGPAGPPPAEVAGSDPGALPPTRGPGALARDPPPRSAATPPGSGGRSSPIYIARGARDPLPLPGRGDTASQDQQHMSAYAPLVLLRIRTFHTLSAYCS